MARRIPSLLTHLQFFLLIASAFSDELPDSQLEEDFQIDEISLVLSSGDVEAQVTDHFSTSKIQLAPHDLVQDEQKAPSVTHSTPESEDIAEIAPGDDDSNQVPTGGDVPRLCSEVGRLDSGGTCGSPAEQSDDSGVINSEGEAEKRWTSDKVDRVGGDRDAIDSETLHSKLRLDEADVTKEVGGRVAEGMGVGRLGEGKPRAQQQAGRGISSLLLPELQRLRALVDMEQQRVDEMQILLTRITYLAESASDAEGRDRWQAVIEDSSARERMRVDGVPPGRDSMGGQLAPLGAASKAPVVVGKKGADWEDWFDFLAAVRLEAEVACILVGRVTAG